MPDACKTMEQFETKVSLGTVMTYFESLWTGMTQYRMFEDRKCTLLLLGREAETCEPHCWIEGVRVFLSFYYITKDFLDF